jgi:hypothetical protein
MARTDPPPRLALWRKEDLEERLKVHREFAAAGEQLIPDADREQMERDIARLKGKPPDLASKAAIADKHWIPLIGGALRADGLSRVSRLLHDSVPRAQRTRPRDDAGALRV